MKTQVLVFPTLDQHYAASKTSASANAATTPDALAVGAVGLYTLNAAGAMTLVQRGNSAKLTNLTIFKGTADGAVRLPTFNPQGLRRMYSWPYSAAVPSFGIVGFNGTTSTGLRLPTIAAGTTVDAAIRIYNMGSGTPPDFKTITVNVSSTDTPYSTALKFYAANLIKETGVPTFNVFSTSVGIVTNGTNTVFASAKTLTLVKGSTTLTMGEAVSGFTTGSFCRLQGQTYQIVGTASSDTVLTLDRPFHGNAVTTLDASGNTSYGTLASITEAGILLFGANGIDLELALEGAFASSTLTEFANKSAITIAGIAYAKATNAFGTPAQVADIERRSATSTGQSFNIESWWPQFSPTATTGTFDTIGIEGTFIDTTPSPAEINEFEYLLFFNSDSTDANDTGLEATYTILSTLLGFVGGVVENSTGTSVIAG